MNPFRAISGLGGCPRIEKNDQMGDTGEYKIRPYLRSYQCYCSGFWAIVGANLVFAWKMAISHSRTAPSFKLDS
jgi:hypothetical protein